MQNRFKNIKVQMLVAAVALSSTAAFAEAPSASEIVTLIAGFGAFVAAVGGAMVLLTVAKKAWGKIGG
ncbi:hypothetical protein HYO24_19965 [Vibrio parahaemolyticus]|nr:hypothetical protein [Vibrio parahaemolyticus]MBM4963855.1 hypothetical protein [Vibrio parahaemolyticus]